MYTKRNTIILTAAALVVLLSTTVWNVFAGSVLGTSDDYEKSIQWGKELAWSPAGVWVVSVPTPMGTILMLHTMHAQDLAGTRYGGVMWEVNNNPTNFGVFPDGEKEGYWATQTVRTGPGLSPFGVWGGFGPTHPARPGPDALETTMIGYATKASENAPDEVVTINIANVTWRITGPDTNEGEATLMMYLASQDGDGDGFPDEGEKPVACMPFTFSSHRLRVMPGCVPTPMPETPKQ